jgi:3-oxoacyl-[acyl-carrier-protein] synthase II
MGIGAKDFFDRLMTLQTCIRSIPPEYEKKYKFKSRVYVPFPELRLSDYGIDSPYIKIMEKTALLSLVGTQLALRDASAPPVEHAHVIIGVGLGALYSSFQSHVAHVTDHASTRYNRMIIPMQMPNAASAWVSILFGIQGFNYTLNASCASGTVAIGEAYLKLVAGQGDIALAGGLECLEDKSGSIMRGFDCLNVLTKAADGHPRPFSAGRSGFLFSDGAGCMLVIEELQHALNRGAGIYCEIDAYACASDAYNIVQLEPSGARISALMSQLASGEKIDYLNAHGTGTVENDAVEASVIQKIFGGKASQPYINSTKGLLGHSIGASGALEAAVAAMAIKEGRIHGNLLTAPLPDLNLPEAALATPVDCALSLSYGFGGHIAGLRLKRYRGDE